MRPRIGPKLACQNEGACSSARLQRGSSVSQSVGRVPQRRNARSNRARILATARQELGRNPDITLEELARASGVVRRTLFGHFPGRAALLEALAEEAAEALQTAVAVEAPVAEPADRALAHFTLSMWPVGDRYRMLLALARRDLGVERVNEILKPARVRAAGILEQGQREGVFHSHLPPAVLSAGLEAMAVALLEEVNTGAFEDDGTRVAVATLIAAGVPEEQALTVVDVAAAAAAAEHVADE
jgi:AcrR family transcriptional regulator